MPISSTTEILSSPRPFLVAAAGIAALCALDAAVKELTRSYAVAYAVLGLLVVVIALLIATGTVPIFPGG